MIQQKWRLHINCQKGKSVQTKIIATGEVIEIEGIRVGAAQRAVGGCQLGEIRVTVLKDDLLSENYDLALETPVKV